jgi:hypothetical protein
MFICWNKNYSKQGYVAPMLKSSLPKLYRRHHELVDRHYTDVITNWLTVIIPSSSRIGWPSLYRRHHELVYRNCWGDYGNMLLSYKPMKHVTTSHIYRRHDITEILLKMALNIITLTLYIHRLPSRGHYGFSQFSGCWLILSVYIIMSFDFPFVRLLGIR